MSAKMGESRSLVGVAFEGYAKYYKAQKRADAAARDLKRWVRELNAVEVEEYNAQVEAFKAENEAAEEA